MTVRTVLLHFNVPVDNSWCGVCGHSEERHNRGPNADECDCSCSYLRQGPDDPATLVTLALQRLAAVDDVRGLRDFLALAEAVD